MGKFKEKVQAIVEDALMMQVKEMVQLSMVMVALQQSQHREDQITMVKKMGIAIAALQNHVSLE
jgi:hypothetical protein